MKYRRGRGGGEEEEKWKRRGGEKEEKRRRSDDGKCKYEIVGVRDEEREGTG